MGLAPLWRLRSSPKADVVPEPRPAGRRTEAIPAMRHARSESGEQVVRPTPQERSVEQRPAPTPIPEEAAPAARAPEPASPQQTTPDPLRSARIAGLDWAGLEDEIRACRACRLCEKRRQAVPGVGDRKASWMLVGEGPGADEDRLGEPFVGQAGKLLDNMLAALGLTRAHQVFIANAVKCRPPHNRTPEADEIAACLPFLQRQIELVQPRLLIALGRPGAQALLDTAVSIGAARGKRFERQGVPVVVTYHPAYLLRNPQDKGKAWEDLCFARSLVSPD
ncbi:DNA polymerase III [Parazoarcus communis]|uniref:Type-4 uracil-DNA glycosylase n=1 Tax=Parazoarcus communis TaxID=41977 RepID=A0A2U8GPX7_9RHOO|nr:uracil-DNA glycosylase [Parazoarcus communis]AWI74545.1 DNA polymerase III [Parazoarcus communis]